MFAKTNPINIKKESKQQHIITPNAFNKPFVEPTNITNFRCNNKNIIFNTEKIIKIFPFE